MPQSLCMALCFPSNDYSDWLIWMHATTIQAYRTFTITDTYLACSLYIYAIWITSLLIECISNPVYAAASLSGLRMLFHFFRFFLCNYFAFFVLILRPLCCALLCKLCLFKINENRQMLTQGVAIKIKHKMKRNFYYCIIAKT